MGYIMVSLTVAALKTCPLLLYTSFYAAITWCSYSPSPTTVVFIWAMSHKIIPLLLRGRNCATLFYGLSEYKLFYGYRVFPLKNNGQLNSYRSPYCCCLVILASLVSCLSAPAKTEFIFILEKVPLETFSVLHFTHGAIIRQPKCFIFVFNK